MSEQDFYDHLPFSFGGAESQRLPQNLSVKFKDPQWAGHWFNRKANYGQRVSEAKAMGFVPAKREDCDWVAHSINDEDGAIVDNDLVLMKVHKLRLMQRVKTWMDEAVRKGGKAAYMETAQNSAGSQKVSHYFTPQSNEFSGIGAVTQIPTVS
jgi:hypothetical protein